MHLWHKAQLQFNLAKLDLKRNEASWLIAIIKDRRLKQDPKHKFKEPNYSITQELAII